jgi:hypothetical protein
VQIYIVTGIKQQFISKTPFSWVLPYNINAEHVGFGNKHNYNRNELAAGAQPESNHHR